MAVLTQLDHAFGQVFKLAAFFKRIGHRVVYECFQVSQDLCFIHHAVFKQAVGHAAEVLQYLIIVNAKGLKFVVAYFFFLALRPLRVERDICVCFSHNSTKKYTYCAIYLRSRK